MMAADCEIGGGPFGKDFRPTPRSSISRSELSALDPLYTQYQDFLTFRADIFEDQLDYDTDKFPLQSKTREKLDSIVDVLTPFEIQSFINLTQSDENKLHYGHNTGLFLSRLISLSHESGNNDFVMDLRGLKPIDYVGYNLIEKEDQTLRILVRGTLGYHGMYKVEGGIYYIEESAYCLAQLAKNITLYANNTNDHCGVNSRKSFFYIKSVDKLVELYSRHSIECVYYEHEPGFNFGQFDRRSTYHVVKATHPLPDPDFPNCHQLDLSEWEKLWQPAEDVFTRGGFQ